MARQSDELKYDFRIVHLNIKRGNLTLDEYKKHLKSLPDLENQTDEVPAFTDELEEEFGNLTFSV